MKKSALGVGAPRTVVEGKMLCKGYLPFYSNEWKEYCQCYVSSAKKKYQNILSFVLYVGKSKLQKKEKL